MTGDAGGYAQATIEIEAAEAAAGAVKVVWTPQYGQVTVQVPPGTVDGVVTWAQGPAGPVAVTIRVRHPQQQWGAPPPGYSVPQPGYPAPVAGYPAGPPTAKPVRKGLLIGVGSAVAVVLIAGCCIGGRLIISNNDNNKAAQPTGSATTGVTNAGPIAPAAYSQLLSSADTALKTDFAKLNTANQSTLATAGPATAQSMKAQADRLLAVTPPGSASSANKELAGALQAWADVVQDVGATKSPCPAAGGPYPDMLRSQFATDVRAAAKDLAAADPTFKFGTFLPAAPKQQSRRLANGAFVKKPGKRGLGHLEIKNGAGDTTISLVPTSGKKPTLTVYVRSKAKFTATGVADGTYRIYSATGQDWNPSKKGFTRGCGFTKFDDTFKFTTTSTASTIWQITLTPVANGNASTSSVDPDAFPTD
jgi:hypothetical protein